MERKHIIGLEQVMEYSLEEELHTMMAHKDALFVMIWAVPIDSTQTEASFFATYISLR